MTKKDVLEKIKKVNLPKNLYVIYGAAPLVLYGIREVNDIDMLITPELYELLKQQGWKNTMKGPKDEPLVYDIFEAHNTWEFSTYAPTFAELLSRAVIVDGIPFASLDDIRKWKAAWGRSKDLADIKLIDAYLTKHK